MFVRWLCCGSLKSSQELSDDSRRVGNMMLAMMKMKKLEIEPLREAFNRPE